ncbi:UNVERIFIED_CONTAM: hypothetical protein GTU68_024425 [Idotea baltica]|nr:hypothetical protein [Idotea baltica]
MSVSRKVL